jgi:hypothetical protein
LQTGLAFLQQLASAAGQPAAAKPAAGARPAGLAFVARDERTGEPYLRLPMPSPQVIETALQAFGALLEGLRR